MIELDTSTLEEIGALLMGNNGPCYRTGRDLRSFLQRAGIDELPPDTMNRPDTARQALSERTGETANAELVILRLADPREFANDKTVYEETLRQLNEILSLEAMRIVRDDRGRPSIADLPAVPDNEGQLHDVELKVSLDQIIRNPSLAAIAQERLDEARQCQSVGAYVASIIMLGSLLEGILLATAQERLQRELPRPAERITLSDLMKLAREEGWIQFDAHLGSDLIRQYRNLVHPRLQLSLGHPPDADTMGMCWPVVNAVLNDLAATA